MEELLSIKDLLVRANKKRKEKKRLDAIVSALKEKGAWATRISAPLSKNHAGERHGTWTSWKSRGKYAK